MKIKESWRIHNSFDEYNIFVGRFNEFLSLNAVCATGNYALNVGVEELISNIIKYNPSTKIIEIDICVHIDDNEIELSVTDNGGAFDLEGAKKADLSLDLDDIQIGGLGIDLVKKLFYSCQYHYVKGHNSVQLKYLVDK